MDECVVATIAWCNERRAEKGLPQIKDLPKGIRADIKKCPCGDATGLSVSNNTWWDTTETDDNAESFSHSHILPDKVVEFIRAFDDCEYPQYDLEADD